MLELKKKFCSKFKISDSGCWEWIGPTNSTGYGYFYLGKEHEGGIKGTGAHRASYYLFKGQIPEGKFVLHTCDNRKCVNPAHLFLGSQIDNMQDCIQKGRDCRGERMREVVLLKIPRGEGHYNTSLNKNYVKQVGS